MNVLYPPLALIREGLFGPSGQAARQGSGGAYDDCQPILEEILPSIEPPDFLKNLISRKVASAEAFSSACPLASGQIRRINRVGCANSASERPLNRSVGVLLGAHLGAGRWLGWLVAQEADYAGDRDLVLEASDGPYAPEAALVQC